MTTHKGRNYWSAGVKRTALSLALTACFAGGVQAQSNTSGSVFGTAASGDTITVVNTQTGLSRTVTANADGTYRVSALPAGDYKVTRSSAAGESSERTTRVNTGAGANVSFVTAAASSETSNLDAVTVIGASAVNPIDVSSVESVTILTEAQIDRIPVPRSVTNVALLAPGTVRGDGRFGNLASFGGSSVAENVYYINGFNVTNIVNGLAFSELPFEAIQEQQIKTGGYGAEFGRSLGGVINITTKQGTNEWKAGANVFYSPDSLASGTPLAYDPERDGSYRIVDTDSKKDSVVYNVYGGGPLIKDRLFFFGLFQGTKEDEILNYAAGHDSSTLDSPQGLVKLDWYISDNHRLELTAFRDKEVTDGITYSRADGDFTIGGGTRTGTFRTETGGDNYIGRWTGYITENLTLSALYGKGKYSRGEVNSNAADCPVVIDVRSSGTPPLGASGCWVGTGVVGIPDAGDERTAWRFDGEWVLGDHTVRFGLDDETFETVDGSEYSGAGYWRYLNASPGARLANGAIVPDGVTEVVRFRYFGNGGNFETQNSAWYLEDTWQITDTLNLYGGIRNESFKNLNSNGGAFVDIKDTWAPRLGFSWDVNGDSTFKVFGNAGRYYIPVYSNTNVRLAGAELDYQEFYTFSAIDPVTGVPTLGTEIGTRSYTSSGEVPDPRAVVDNDLDPMYQDEYIAGIQFQLAPNWTAGVRAIYRELKSGMDDICSGDGAEAWALQNGYSEDQAGAIAEALSHCFLTNPGQNLSANVDLDGTGELSVVNIPATAIGIPEAKRKYSALEFMLEKAWDNKWFMSASYTFAKSKGNTEGYVKSDNGQGDAGITQDFDYPGLMDGSYGYLPNDRRHSFKLFGAYALTDELRIGANLLVQSGRPVNCFGIYPADGPDQHASGYGVASFYCGANGSYDYANSLHPRGTSGRVPWVRTLDLQLAYEPQWAPGLNFRIDVNNVLDSDDYYRVQDNWDAGAGEKIYDYKNPRGFVAPRSVMFSIGYDF
ncbi:TonB-dependent receptor [Pseudoxanthomonas indica]|uniref:Carboxypeptidase regulatory-like domain-containing protein n=1 Tax=Pseudoxanthomonas indica TaxID=428993 RepID=A0A1T5LJ73_9GAMM|nr:TonB-dependent receptor [Pseudoxanthomonas indica]GGD35865.1 Oar protein [Pseudoxanthomonas indica]SKC76021.1 Carboxypeptidase regulatory-like domain-containing protein [Pseudoxanthomonas indica]